MSTLLIEQILDRWRDLRASGHTTTAAELCAAHPELTPEVQRRIDALSDSSARSAAETIAPPPLGPEAWPAYTPLAPEVAAPVPGRTTTGPPPILPGYEILDKLGQGGMGVVYKAREQVLGRIVALKMILDDREHDPEYLRRFKEEARILARMKHAHVVQVYHFGMHKDRPWLALEYCPGRSLHSRLCNGPLPWREAARLIEQAACGVAHVHAAGVFHRDLKPGNILLDEDCLPKVADFGLARRSDRESLWTQAGLILGTPAYMAPEQIDNTRGVVDGRADVYALGVILYECLTGKRPFTGTDMNILAGVLHREATPPRKHNPGVSPALERICLKCLQKQPGDRYSSAVELADDLHHLLGEQPVVPPPIGRRDRAWSWRRRPTLAGVMGFCLLVLVVLLGVLLLRGPTASEQGMLLQELKRLDCPADVVFVAFSPDGRWLSAGMEAPQGIAVCAILIFDVDGGRPPRSLQFAAGKVAVGRDGPRAAVFSRDGRRLFVGARSGMLHSWDFGKEGERPTASWQGHRLAVEALVFADEQCELFSASHDGSVRRWDVQAGGKERGRFAGDREIGALTLEGSPTSPVLLCGRSDGLLWLDGARMEILERRPDPVARGEGPCGLIAQHPASPLIGFVRGGRITLQAGRPPRALPEMGHQRDVRALAFSPSGSLLASAGADNQLSLWDSRSGQLQARSPLAGPCSLAFCPDGKQLAVASERTVRLLQVEGPGK